MVNECGHSLCQNCVENVFARNVNKCPNEGCAKMLKKSNFWVQQFDDPAIEREIYFRKRISKVRTNEFTPYFVKPPLQITNL